MVSHKENDHSTCLVLLGCCNQLGIQLGTLIGKPLVHYAFGQLNVAMKIVPIEDYFDRFQGMSGYRRNLRHVTPGDKKSRDRRSAQIVKRPIFDPRYFTNHIPE